MAVELYYFQPLGTNSGRVFLTLLEKGVPFIEHELQGREFEHLQPAYLKIVEEFGDQVLQGDGTLDRKALGAIVFADPAKRKRLEEITHPAIGARQQRILSVLDEEAFEGIVIWDAALLFEGGGDAKMDRVVVVYADPDTELARLVARDGLPEADARARIASQMSIAEKAKRAHYVVDNSGDRGDTERQVRTVNSALLAELKARLRA